MHADKLYWTLVKHPKTSPCVLQRLLQRAFDSRQFFLAQFIVHQIVEQQRTSLVAQQTTAVEDT